jgi:tRNA nucleotidyltransferase (CCA-adding enzyme)
MSHSLTSILSHAQTDALALISREAAARGIGAFLVGGAVRDWLLGAPSIDDLDITIEGDAGFFATQLAAAHGGAVQTHARFNTARWMINGLSIDLTTARAERYAHPGALPTVEPAAIAVDLQRRDFSVNAIALRLSDNALLDPFDGQADLRTRRLRALHAQSFVDDPTRMLRAARYATRLGFEPDAATLGWIEAGLPHLRALSGERVKYDLELIFADAAPAAALEMLAGWGVFRALGIPVPEALVLQTRFERIATALSTDDLDDGALALEPAALLNAAGWGALTYAQGQLPVTRWVELIPFDAQLRDALVEHGVLSTLMPRLLQTHTSAQSAQLKDISVLALFLGSLFDAHPVKRHAFNCEWKDWRWVRPATTGDDLKALGLQPGPRFKTLLEQLRAAWLDGEVVSLEQERALLERLIAAEME